MREIVSIHVGRCGSGIGAAFWEGAADEHGIDNSGQFVGNSPLQLMHIDGFFDEIGTERYVPRAVMCDLNPVGLDRIKNWPIGQLFRQDTLITGFSDACNNFAKGFNVSSEEGLFPNAMSAIRKEFETADSVQGIKLSHSLGGGTGSGFTSKLLRHLYDEFRVPIRTFSLFPSPNSAEIVVEAYNTILGLLHLIDYAEVSICFDNNALGNCAVRIFDCKHPGVVDNNRLVAMTALGLTACSRFPGQLNVGMNKLSTALLPLPGMHFLQAGLSKFARGENHVNQVSDRPVKEVLQSLLSPQSMLASCDLAQGKAMTAGAILRGRLPVHAAEAAMVEFRTKRAELFPDWLPYNLSLGICDIPPRGDALSATFLVNHSSTVQLFQQQSEQVKLMLSTSKAFFHLFEQNGISQDDMMSAVNAVDSVVESYLSTVNSDVPRNTSVQQKQRVLKPEPVQQQTQRFGRSEPAQQQTQRFARSEPAQQQTQRFARSEPAQQQTQRFARSEPAQQQTHKKPGMRPAGGSMSLRIPTNSRSPSPMTTAAGNEGFANTQGNNAPTDGAAEQTDSKLFPNGFFTRLMG